jgi:hypothetical protein
LDHGLTGSSGNKVTGPKLGLARILMGADGGRIDWNTAKRELGDEAI